MGQQMSDESPGALFIHMQYFEKFSSPRPSSRAAKGMTLLKALYQLQRDTPLLQDGYSDILPLLAVL
jgi:hypothetical protein